MDNKFKISVELITPDIAKEMLKKNIINRNISPQRVKQYAMDMKNLKWECNGEAIKFNERDELIDGAHRLHAIIYAGIPVLMTVIRGIDNDVTIFDRGRGRSVSDSLVLSGYDKLIANVTSVAIAKLHFAVQYNLKNVADSQVKSFIDTYANTLLKMREKGISKNNGKNKNSGLRINTSSACFQLPCLYAIEIGADIDLISKFINILCTGFYENVNEVSAIVLRNDYLSNNLVIGGNTEDRVKAVYMVEKSIDDFLHRRNRKKSYYGCILPVFSDNIKFKTIK